MLILEDWNFYATNTVSKNAVLQHCILGFTSVTAAEKKNIDFKVSNLEVILLVLLAFMEFLHINEVVMWCINKNCYYYYYYFWERQRWAFFDVRICHPNADSYRDMDLNQIYRQHETEKKRQYASRIEF